MAAQVFPNFKPDPNECVCGCGLIGQPRAKAWSDGLGPHVRRCQCRRCEGGRMTSRARREEHKTARRTGGKREPFSGALSGVDGRAGLWVWEETANQAVTAGLRRWWNNKGTRKKVARLYGRPGGEHRAFIAKDEKPYLVVMLWEDWADAVGSGDL